MKKIFLVLTFILRFASPSIGQNIVQFDPVKSKILWTGHAEIGSYAPSGTLNLLSGEAKIQDGKINSSLIIIDMKSMKQENAHLLEHLKSEDFFDVDRFPISQIKINRIKDGVAFGTITIKNKSKGLVCPVNIRREKDHLSVSGKVTIDRTQFGIIFNSGNFFSGLGDKAIRNTFEVEFELNSSN